MKKMQKKRLTKGWINDGSKKIIDDLCRSKKDGKRKSNDPSNIGPNTEH